MKVSERILRYLSDNGVKSTFGVPCGTLCHILDSLNDFDKIEYIIPQNEAAATYSACKSAKISNKLQVAMVSGAVGVANGMNGIAEAVDSKVPLLILSGYVDENIQGKCSMQDMEAHKYLEGIVKYNVVIHDEKNVLKELKKAMEIALTPPRGPVHIGLPINIQKLEYTGDKIENIFTPNFLTDYTTLEIAVHTINNLCTNGIIFVGGGCRGLTEEIKLLAEKINWRIVTSSSGKGIIEEDYKLNMGNFGFPSTDLAHSYMQRSDIDCVLVLGSQLGQNSTENYTKSLNNDRILIHIDTDKKVFNTSYEEDISILADLKDALEYMIKHINYKDLKNDIEKALNEPYIKNHTGLSLRKFCEELPKYLPDDTFYISDIGSTLCYANKYLNIHEKGDYELNTNHACMGSGIGYIGINRLNPNRPIALLTGDGSFYMNLMSEMITAKKYNMKVVFFVNNNSNLRFVKDGMNTIFGRTTEMYNTPYINISLIAKSMNIRSIQISSNDEINRMQSLKNIDGPILVELLTDCSEQIPTAGDRFKKMN